MGSISDVEILEMASKGDPTLIPVGIPVPAYADSYTVNKFGRMLNLFFLRLPIAHSAKRIEELKALSADDELEVATAAAVTLDREMALALARTIQELAGEGT